jgi:hypothetical protein
MLPDAPGMQVPPRGINEAQLGGRSPRDFPLLPDDTPPPTGPLFGPDDEVPGPMAPALFRGVPEGADPMAPNQQGFTTWSNQRPVAERYGSNVGEMPFKEAEFPNRGTLEELRAAVGAGPEATAQDIVAALLAREPELRGCSYDLRPELEGTPREFIRRGR